MLPGKISKLNMTSRNTNKNVLILSLNIIKDCNNSLMNDKLEIKFKIKIKLKPLTNKLSYSIKMLSVK